MTYPQFPPPPAPVSRPPGTLRRGLSYVWAVLPLVTVGLGAPFVMGYAAARLRSAWLWLATGLYTLLWVVALVTSSAADGSGGSALFDGAIGVLMVVGTVHAVVIRPRLARRPERSALDAAMAVAKERRAARDRARELAARDPVLARQLRIGRPDLPRSFDDGGLIDVNAAPPAVLAELPGMTPQLVDRIVHARQEIGAFISAEELSVAAQLPPALTDEIAEYAIFLT